MVMVNLFDPGASPSLTVNPVMESIAESSLVMVPTPVDFRMVIADRIGPGSPEHRMLLSTTLKVSFISIF